MSFRAMESKTAIDRSLRDWRHAFSGGADILERGSLHLTWLPELGIWGAFSEKSNGGHWNLFGLEPYEPRSNIIVEINPPRSGISKSLQGVIAKSDDGSRWIFHRGRLHSPKYGINISRDMFAAVSRCAPEQIIFSDGTSQECFRVANIDAVPATLQKQMAEFIQECSYIRTYYQHGESVAQQAKKIASVEATLFPEATGQYEVSPQGSKTAILEHGAVWASLCNLLRSKGIKFTNSRLGRYGPDLRTLSETPILFELKTDVKAGSIQQGVGQLFLYEKLLEQKHRKVLVLPDYASERFSLACAALDIIVARYSKIGRSIKFEFEHVRLS